MRPQPLRRRAAWHGAAVVAALALLTAGGGLADPARDAGAEDTSAKDLPPAYRLGTNECLRWVPAPFPAERAAWLRAIKAPGQHSLFFFSSGTPRFGGYTYGTGPVTLADVCRVTLGLYPYEIEAEPGVLRSQIPEGDYVVDRRAPRARTAAALEDLCRTQLMLRLRLSLKDVEQKVVVARGEFRRDPAAKPETPIELADDAGRTGPQRGGGQLPFGDFLKQLGAYLGRPVLSEVKRMPEGPVTYVVRRALLGEEPLPVEVPSALKHLAAQTGLTFTEETRRVSVLHVRSD